MLGKVIVVVLIVALGIYLVKRCGCLCGAKKEEGTGEKKGGSCCQ